MKYTKEEYDSLIPRKFLYLIALVVLGIGITSPIAFGLVGIIVTIICSLWIGLLWVDIKIRNQLGIKK